MKTFVDSSGRVWEFELNIGAVKRVRALVKIDLLNLTEGEPNLLRRLTQDIVLLVDSIFAVLRPQALTAGVTDEEFAARLAPPAIGRAVTAFWEELADFFRDCHPTVGAILRQYRQAVNAPVPPSDASNDGSPSIGSPGSPASSPAP